jgi:predicted outer membrane repeat protein
LVDNCSFVGNFITTTATATADVWVQGGAMYLRSNGNYTVSNCLFENCSSSKEAGALYVQTGSSGVLSGTTVLVVNTTFKNNVAKANGKNINGGGAVQVKQYQRVTFRNVTFTNNTANIGGAMTNTYHNSGQSSLEVYDCKFIDNKATEDGGAIYSDDVPLNLHHSSFINNTADRNGGGLYLSERAASSKLGIFYTYNLNFTDNKAFSGSAIYSATNLTLSNVEMLKNRANSSSFVVTKYDNGTITIDFKGWDNYLNGIYMSNSVNELKVRNVTYWNENTKVTTPTTQVTWEINQP